MITEIVLISTNVVTALFAVFILVRFLNLKRKYDVVSADPIRSANERFADLLARGRGLYYIEKLEERDVYIRRS